MAGNREISHYSRSPQCWPVFDRFLYFQEKGYKELTKFSQDSLSSIFFLRTHEFKAGSSIQFPMTTNGSQWETEVQVIEREELKTPMVKMNAVKVKILTRFKGVLQQQGDSFLWFTDDDRKYLLRFEAKVKIGWVSGITKKIQPGEILQ